MEGGAWWAAVHEVANSRTQLSDFTFTFTWSLSWDSSFPQLQLGMFSMICLFFSFLPVMLLSEIPKLPTDPPVRGFPIVWKLLLLHDSLHRSPSVTLLSLFLSFLFCPTSFRREWAAFLGAWCLLPAFRRCFVEVEIF